MRKAIPSTSVSSPSGAWPIARAWKVVPTIESLRHFCPSASKPSATSSAVRADVAEPEERLEVRLVVGCVTVVDEDGSWARARAAEVVQPYLDVVARHDPTLEPGAEPRVERFCIAGTPDEVAVRVIELWDLAQAIPEDAVNENGMF